MGKLGARLMASDFYDAQAIWSEKENGGKSKKGQRTVKKILNSAHEIFIRDGHAGLSLRSVADHAGIALGNLTYHFPTKDILLQDMLRRWSADHLKGFFLQIQHQRGSPFELLLNAVALYVRHEQHHSRFFCQFWAYASDGKAKALTRVLYQPVEQLFSDLIGSANPKMTDIEVRRAATQIISATDGYKLLTSLDASNAAVETAADDVQALTKRIIMNAGA